MLAFWKTKGKDARCSSEILSRIQYRVTFNMSSHIKLKCYNADKAFCRSIKANGMRHTQNVITCKYTLHLSYLLWTISTYHCKTSQLNKNSFIYNFKATIRLYSIKKIIQEQPISKHPYHFKCCLTTFLYFLQLRLEIKNSVL